MANYGRSNMGRLRLLFAGGSFHGYIRKHSITFLSVVLILLLVASVVSWPFSQRQLAQASETTNTGTMKVLPPADPTKVQVGDEVKFEAAYRNLQYQTLVQGMTIRYYATVTLPAGLTANKFSLAGCVAGGTTCTDYTVPETEISGTSGTVNSANATWSYNNQQLQVSFTRPLGASLASVVTTVTTRVTDAALSGSTLVATAALRRENLSTTRVNAREISFIPDATPEPGKQVCSGTVKFKIANSGAMLQHVAGIVFGVNQIDAVFDPPSQATGVVPGIANSSFVYQRDPQKILPVVYNSSNLPILNRAKWLDGFSFSGTGAPTSGVLAAGNTAEVARHVRYVNCSVGGNIAGASSWERRLMAAVVWASNGGIEVETPVFAAVKVDPNNVDTAYILSNSSKANMDTRFYSWDGSTPEEFTDVNSGENVFPWLTADAATPLTSSHFIYRLRRSGLLIFSKQKSTMKVVGNLEVADSSDGIGTADPTSSGQSVKQRQIAFDRQGNLWLYVGDRSNPAAGKVTATRVASLYKLSITATNGMPVRMDLDGDWLAGNGAMVTARWVYQGSLQFKIDRGTCLASAVASLWVNGFTILSEGDTDRFVFSVYRAEPSSTNALNDNNGAALSKNQYLMSLPVTGSLSAQTNLVMGAQDPCTITATTSQPTVATDAPANLRVVRMLMPADTIPRDIGMAGGKFMMNEYENGWKAYDISSWKTALFSGSNTGSQPASPLAMTFPTGRPVFFSSYSPVAVEEEKDWFDVQIIQPQTTAANEVWTFNGATGKYETKVNYVISVAQRIAKSTSAVPDLKVDFVAPQDVRGAAATAKYYRLTDTSGSDLGTSASKNGLTQQVTGLPVIGQGNTGLVELSVTYTSDAVPTSGNVEISAQTVNTETQVVRSLVGGRDALAGGSDAPAVLTLKQNIVTPAGESITIDENSSGQKPYLLVARKSDNAMFSGLPVDTIGVTRNTYTTPLSSDANISVTASTYANTISGTTGQASVTNVLVPAGKYTFNAQRTTSNADKGFYVSDSWECKTATDQTLAADTTNRKFAVTLSAGQKVTCTVTSYRYPEINIRGVATSAQADLAPRIGQAVTGNNGEYELSYRMYLNNLSTYAGDSGALSLYLPSRGVVPSGPAQVTFNANNTGATVDYLRSAGTVVDNRISIPANSVGSTTSPTIFATNVANIPAGQGSAQPYFEVTLPVRLSNTITTDAMTSLRTCNARIVQPPQAINGIQPSVFAHEELVGGVSLAISSTSRLSLSNGDAWSNQPGYAMQLTDPADDYACIPLKFAWQLDVTGRTGVEGNVYDFSEQNNASELEIDPNGNGYVGSSDFLLTLTNNNGTEQHAPSLDLSDTLNSSNMPPGIAGTTPAFEVTKIEYQAVAFVNNNPNRVTVSDSSWIELSGNSKILPSAAYGTINNTQSKAVLVRVHYRTTGSSNNSTSKDNGLTTVPWAYLGTCEPPQPAVDDNGNVIAGQNLPTIVGIALQVRPVNTPSLPERLSDCVPLEAPGKPILISTDAPAYQVPAVGSQFSLTEKSADESIALTGSFAAGTEIAKGILAQQSRPGAGTAAVAAALWGDHSRGSQPVILAAGETSGGYAERGDSNFSEEEADFYRSRVLKYGSTYEVRQVEAATVSGKTAALTPQPVRLRLLDNGGIEVLNNATGRVVTLEAPTSGDTNNSSTTIDGGLIEISYHGAEGPPLQPLYAGMWEITFHTVLPVDLPAAGSHGPLPLIAGGLVLVTAGWFARRRLNA